MPPSGVDTPAVGIGFRKEIAKAILSNLKSFDVLEVTVDHYIYGNPAIRDLLREISRRIPIVAHGVGLSIGTAVEPDARYLEGVAEFIEFSGSPSYSEHLAFTKTPELDLAQLMPLPRTREMIDILDENIGILRRYIPVPFALENITYYFEFPGAELSEIEFLREVLARTRTSLLLDLENLYINSRNHGYDALAFLRDLPRGCVKGVHLAGGKKQGEVFVDSHDSPVPDTVFTLLEDVLSYQSPDTLIVERDQALESLKEPLEDVRRVRQVLQERSSRPRAEAGA